MFFLLAFALHVIASFAFLLAILIPNWLTVENVQRLGGLSIQRGIFYVCDILTQNTTYQTSRCASILNFDSSINSPNRWNYNLATSSASIAIGCAGLSIIVLWLSGFYFNVRNKNKCTSCFLISTSILLILTFSASVAVWILIISETLVLGYTVNRSILNWPFWLAVSSSGGYFLAFLFMQISFCNTVCCGNRHRRRNLYYPENTKY